MTNDKQQTALEWYIEQHNILAKISDNLSHGEIVKRISDIEKQAKEMEKEQMKKTASYWQKMGILVATKIPNRKTFEQWFSETYGGDKL